jgi:hypothetical protein
MAEESITSKVVKNKIVEIKKSGNRYLLYVGGVQKESSSNFQYVKEKYDKRT